MLSRNYSLIYKHGYTLNNLVNRFTTINRPALVKQAFRQDHPIRLASSKSLIPCPANSSPNRFPRTHYCGTLRIEHEGERVNLSGWIQWIRYKNFLILRDVKGLIQVYFDEDFLKDPEKASLVANLKQESVVWVNGVVRRRPDGQANSKIPTGEIEIKCEEIRLLSAARANLPFEINDFNRPGEASRLKYRYLDLR